MIKPTQKQKAYINNITCSEASVFLKKLPENSVDIILTDPPYFLDKLDDRWDTKKVNNKKNLQIVKSLPAGMKFDRLQGQNFYKWYFKISKELLRVLKPGGFFFSFSSPRLYHRMTSAMDDAGFEIRDSFIWLYTQNQVKAMSLNHFINRLDIPKQAKQTIINSLEGWKTPQVKSCYEPIAMAQKATEGTFLENTLKYNVSLVNTNIKQGSEKEKFISNVMTTDCLSERIDKVFLVDKPTKQEKGQFNTHKTVKPLSLCEYLVAMTTRKQAVVLDPFCGSGTTALAAQNLGRNFIGVDLNKDYVAIATRRLKDAAHKNYSSKPKILATNKPNDHLK